MDVAKKRVNTNEVLMQSLESLAEFTFSTAQTNRKNAKPEGHVDYYVWDPTNLSPMFSIRKESRPDYSQTFWNTIKQVEDTELFNKSLDLLCDIDEKFDLALTSFITAITAKAFSSKDVDIRNIVGNFIKDLNGEAQEYRANVRLDGITVESPTIQLDSNTRLRNPKLRDLYLVRTVEPNYPDNPLRKFTLFLDIKTCVNNQNEAHEVIEHSISTLQLFKPGGIQGVFYDIDSDSITNPIVSKTSFDLGLNSNTYRYTISKQEEESLLTFWASLKTVELPHLAKITREKTTDQLSIAYERYLEYFKSTLFDKQILYLVSGLEGLFLKPEEKTDLKYKLSLRAGKLLGLIGYDAYEVREKICVAYDIRSKYAHGYISKNKDFDKVLKFGNVDEFSTSIADYLRASIVALLKRPPKDNLITKLDNSFLDTDIENKIKELLFSPKEVT